MTQQASKNTRIRRDEERRFRCPFRVALPERYRLVTEHCAENQSFQKTSHVNEHLKRYHSRRYWCMVCKKNFPGCSDSNIDKTKNDHACTPREWTKEEELKSHTWMTPEQQEAWEGRNSVKKTPTIEMSILVKRWYELYKSLFPNAPVVPGSCFPDDQNNENKSSVAAIPAQGAHAKPATAAPSAYPSAATMGVGTVYNQNRPSAYILPKKRRISSEHKDRPDLKVSSSQSKRRNEDDVAESSMTRQLYSQIDSNSPYTSYNHGGNAYTDPSLFDQHKMLQSGLNNYHVYGLNPVQGQANVPGTPSFEPLGAPAPGIYHPGPSQTTTDTPQPQDLYQAVQANPTVLDQYGMEQIQNPQVNWTHPDDSA